MKSMWIIEMGGSPRPDLISDVRKILGISFEIHEIGVLDGLSEKDMERMKPEGQEPQIRTITSEKKEIFLRSDAVEKRISELISDINPRKGDPILVACDEDYDSIQPPSLVYFPSRIFGNAVSSIVRGKKIAVIFPVEEQIERLGKHWMELTDNVRFAAFTPFDREAVLNGIKNLDLSGLDAIVFDCFGFTTEHKREIEDITGLPCILPRSVVLGTMATLL